MSDFECDFEITTVRIKGMSRKVIYADKLFTPEIVKTFDIIDSFYLVRSFSGSRHVLTCKIS